MISVNIKPVVFQTKQFGNVVVDEKTVNLFSISSVEPIIKDQQAKVRIIFYKSDESVPGIVQFVGETSVELNADEYNNWTTDDDLINTILNKLNLERA